MNDYVLSVLLGIVEGVTEFLPVSSTAHLRIAESLLHIRLDSDYWKMYSIVIQLGAILCLPLYFRERLRNFIRTFPRGSRGDRNLITHPLSLTIIGTAMTAAPALVLKKLISKNLESLTVIGLALVVGGVIMWIVDVVYGARERAGDPAVRTTVMQDMSLGQAIWIGLCQTFSAVFPGTSRSMATIAAGQLSGMTRAAALEFSFFLSMPTMALATASELKDWLQAAYGNVAPTGSGGLGAVSISSDQLVVLAIGFVVSFVVAYGSVAWFMHWVRKHGFVPFAIYRIVVGAAVLYWMAR